MRVLVLDGNENQAVASVRSLRRAGHAVTVGASTRWSKAGWSRSCGRTFQYPAPEYGMEAFVAAVAAEAARERGTLVLPMTERTTLPLSSDRERIFEAGARMVLPPHPVVLAAFDKQHTTRLAASLGIAVPRTAAIGNEHEAAEASRSLPYPVVLKFRSSEQVSTAGTVAATGRPAYALNPPEFLTAYERMSSRSPEVLAQEFVEGTGCGYFALVRQGELRAEFSHRRIRDVHPTGSGSSLRVSTHPDPKLREASLEILRALGWHGVAMVEFRVRPDGTPVFLEVNGRFWTSLPLAVYAGADFPAWVARMAEGGDVADVPPYRAGVRCRWLLGDFRHLVEVMKGPPSRYPGRFPSRWRTAAAFLVPVPGTWHDNFQWRDPLPEVGDWLDFALRRVPATSHQRKAQRKLHAQGRYSHP